MRFLLGIFKHTGCPLTIGRLPMISSTKVITSVEKSGFCLAWVRAHTQKLRGKKGGEKEPLKVAIIEGRRSKRSSHEKEAGCKLSTTKRWYFSLRKQNFCCFCFWSWEIIDFAFELLPAWSFLWLYIHIQVSRKIMGWLLYAAPLRESRSFPKRVPPCL